MDKKDFRNACMVAGGAAMMAAGGAATFVSNSGIDLSTDIAAVITAVATGVITGGMAVSLLGLTPLAVKYLLKCFKGKNDKGNISTKGMDSVSQHKSMNNDKSSCKGKMKEEMKSGFNRGAPINNPSSHLTRHPVQQANNMAQVRSAQEQSVR